jgi:hypothetical protein
MISIDEEKIEDYASTVVNAVVTTLSNQQILV